MNDGTTRPLTGAHNRTGVGKNQEVVGPDEDRSRRELNTGTPPIVGRTWCDLISEYGRHGRAVPVAFALLLRSIRITALLGLIAYIWGVNARPWDPPMPHWALLTFLVLASPLQLLLYRLIDRRIPKG